MIKPEEVIKDEYGFWTHSQYPDFESEDPEVITAVFDKFKKEHSIKLKAVSFEDDAPEQLQDDWYEKGIVDCRSWTPTPPAENAFLLSIHDTEDSPYAIFAIPLEVD